MIMRRNNLIIGLDIGTTKICAMLGKIGEAGQIEVQGLGLVPSVGLRKGVVINLDETVASINQA